MDIKNFILLRNKYLIFYFLLLSISAHCYSYVDISENKKLGYKVVQSLWHSDEILFDIESQNYIKNLGTDLAKKSINPGKHFDFFIMSNKAINAFASWYGYIGINSGLILFTQNESELASVISHEISHTTLDHLKKRINSEKLESIKTLAGIVASVFVENKELVKAISTSAIANGLQNQISYTRENEAEADNFSSKIIDQTNFDPKGLGTFFMRLEDKAKTNEFLLTHPLSKNRAANNFSRNMNTTDENYRNSFSYKALKARLAVIENSHIYKHNSNDEILYHGAFKYLLEGKYKKASEKIDELTNTNTTKEALLLAGRIYTELNNFPRAKSYFYSIDSFKKYEEVIYFLSKTLMKSNEIEDAIKLLRDYLKNNRNNVYLNELIAEAYLKLSKFDRVHFHKGLALKNKGLFSEALDLMLRAKKETNNKDMLSIIEYQISIIEEKINFLRS